MPYKVEDQQDKESLDHLLEQAPRESWATEHLPNSNLLCERITNFDLI